MNNPLNLSNSELLSAYLDGELSPQSEKGLFEQLASNDALRSEMRDLLAIRSEIETGATYYPPAALKTAAMAKAGLDAAGVGGVAGLFKSTAPFMKTALVPVVSALIGSLFTILVFMNFTPEADSFTKKIAAENSFKNNVVKSETPANAILNEESTADELQKNTDSFKNVTQKERPEMNRNDIVITDNFKTDNFKNSEVLKTASIGENPFKNEITAIPETNFLKENPAHNSFKNSDTPASLKDALKTVEDKFTDEGILPEKSSWLDNMQFEVRGFSLANYPAPRTLPQSDPIFKNMALGAYYTINDEHAIGLEGGQEAFSQGFSGIEEDTTVNYQQYLVLPWAGLSYRWTPDYFGFTNIRPLVGMTLAGTTGGPVGRGILGITLFPESSVSMMIAGEGAIFAYPFQNKIFTSPKLGIMYGVSVKF